ncbi:MAG: FAD-dependent oxidoreductase [Planctomycetes bacterium]|nr:FAD-dependent oxidoreductase [Planctomycetota bacterium]
MTTFVLGGGVAGLVAAFGLRDRGHRVVLLESRGWLGGRAFSSPDRHFDRELDNGPHAMLGCYRAMRALLRRIGTDGDFQQDVRLQMAYRRPGGAVDRLSLSRLPAPLAMPAALWRLRLDWRTKLVALRGMAKSLLGAPAAWTVADWLDRNGQRGEPDALLWRPLCRAIMNVEPELASARSFLGTLREAFSGSAAHAAFWLPRKPWCEVLGAPAARALAAAGAEVRLGQRVAELHREGGRITCITTQAGSDEVGATDLVVSALPWFALAKLLGGEPPVAALASSPIVSAFFELREDAPLLPDDGPVVALVDGDPFHFLLRTPGASPRRFALLSGGSRAFDGQPVAAIERLAREQLARFYPGSDGGAEVRIRKEQHATFVASPQHEGSRPAPGSRVHGLENLRLCGDWTATGLPATLEGAARSAEALLRELDRAR